MYRVDPSYDKLLNFPLPEKRKGVNQIVSIKEKGNSALKVMSEAWGVWLYSLFLFLLAC